MKFFSHDAPEFRDVPTQKLREVQRTEEIRDAAFEHKPIGFFKDAAIRPWRPSWASSSCSCSPSSAPA